jgi:hypothetical protein
MSAKYSSEVDYSKLIELFSYLDFIAEGDVKFVYYDSGSGFAELAIMLKNEQEFEIINPHNKHEEPLTLTKLEFVNFLINYMLTLRRTSIFLFCVFQSATIDKSERPIVTAFVLSNISSSLVVTPLGLSEICALLEDNVLNSHVYFSMLTGTSLEGKEIKKMKLNIVNYELAFLSEAKTQQ